MTDFRKILKFYEKTPIRSRAVQRGTTNGQPDEAHICFSHLHECTQKLSYYPDYLPQFFRFYYNLFSVSTLHIVRVMSNKLQLYNDFILDETSTDSASFVMS
jgi:hypothetical protein